MLTSSRTLLRAGLGFWLAACCALGAEEPGREPGKAANASPERIAAWVRELNADEFLVRETAMLELIEAGPAVLPALKPVLAAGGLEATSRALFIVRQLGLAADIDTQDRAGELLAELAARQETPALARRAAATLQELTDLRSAQALAELESLGAEVARSQIFGGLALDEPVLSIELGADFRGTEHDLRRLRWLVDVPILILNGERITDGWVKQAAAMASLEELHLYQAKITDAGLAPLADHASIKQVGLYYLPVGDKALEPLKKLKLLNFVKLYGTQVTKEEEDRLTQHSPGVTVDRRRGAFLGVGGIELDGTCLISTVHEGSPAEKAGLLREDVIVRFGGKKVGNFGSLTTLIADRDVGEEVEVEVVRRTLDDHGDPTQRRVKTTVKLAPWEVGLAVRNTRR